MKPRLLTTLLLFAIACLFMAGIAYTLAHLWAQTAGALP